MSDSILERLLAAAAPGLIVDLSECEFVDSGGTRATTLRGGHHVGLA
jgi:hypothetical protein